MIEPDEYVRLDAKGVAAAQIIEDGLQWFRGIQRQQQDTAAADPYPLVTQNQQAVALTNYPVEGTVFIQNA